MNITLFWYLKQGCLSSILLAMHCFQHQRKDLIEWIKNVARHLSIPNIDNDIYTVRIKPRHQMSILSTFDVGVQRQWSLARVDTQQHKHEWIHQKSTSTSISIKRQPTDYVILLNFWDNIDQHQTQYLG